MPFPSGLRFNKGNKLVVVEPHGVNLKEFSMRFTPRLTLNGETKRFPGFVDPLN
ncbi:MAG: hypothetical protein ACXADB_12445 [Candidatus Hermodarchaeia archaeon]